MMMMMMIRMIISFSLSQDPRASFENLGKPGALEEFAERVAQIRKDPEVEPILAELDACPAALLKFVDDKQVLKKLGKSMLRSQVKDLSVSFGIIAQRF